MKANDFSNTYQMHKQRGSFQGIDTYNVCSVGDFSFPSVILDESESRTIINRPDINAHLDKLSNDGFLTKNSVEIRRQMARDLYSDTKTFEPYYDGCTYVSLEDAMLTQKDVGSEQLVKMTWDADNSIRGDNIQLVKRN